MKKYLPRIYDGVLADRLAAKGAVLVEGPKWCGKTTTAEQVAGSVVYMQDPGSRAQNQQLARIAPDVLLAGATPRLIDEWQVVPELWDAVRYEVDRRDEFGQFILTGSAVPADLSQVEHTGTGRIARMRMRPMALAESGDSSGEVSLGALFDGERLPVTRHAGDIGELAFLTCRGGWPKAIGQHERVALRQALDYVDAVTEVDISRVDGVNRSSQHARALLRSYARMVSSQGTYESMRRDMVQAGAGVSETTFAGYVEALRKLFVIDDLPAWNPNLRSRTAIRTSPTRHFVDPSLATASLGASPAELLDDLNTFGLVFEDLCVRDLRVYAEALDGEVLHFRDKSGLECDAVVRLRNGRYGLVEVKLGGDALIDEGAKSLLKLRDSIDTERMRAPSFLMVLTGTGEYSYPREDGVLVVPVRTLGA
ncbi:ATP-binding protein [bacterium]|nr:ATP-binding protein [bacterium]